MQATPWAWPIEPRERSGTYSLLQDPCYNTSFRESSFPSGLKSS